MCIEKAKTVLCTVTKCGNTKEVKKKIFLLLP